MNNPIHRPVKNPSKFIKTVFNLGYGYPDHEQLSEAQTKLNLAEAGIDPDVAWSSFQKILDPQPAKKTLTEARIARLASEAASAKERSSHRSGGGIVEEIKKLLDSIGQPSAIFARGWEESSPEDLEAIYEQLKRQAARNAKK